MHWNTGTLEWMMTKKGTQKFFDFLSAAERRFLGMHQ
jgi:hypothetical protein